MRLTTLHLLAFGPFTNRVLDFGSGAHRFVVVYGANEAGKSSALRAMSDLRFGIPVQSKDNFLHAYSDLKLGGEFVDAHGNAYSLLRRKGRGPTLLNTTFASEREHAIDTPASAAIETLLTGGLTVNSYDTMFSLDHQGLRAGGEALLKGEGDIGAALFEASAGVRSIPAIVEALDSSARKFFMPGARGKNARINEAIRNYEEHHAALRQAQIRPAQWADLFRKHQDAQQALTELQQQHQSLHGNLLQIKELRAVAPLITSYDHALSVSDSLRTAPLLPLSAVADRAAAQSGLAAARRSIDLAEKEAQQQQVVLDALDIDDTLLQAEQSIRRLCSDAAAIDTLQRDMADARAQTLAQDQRLAQMAKGIHAELCVDTVLEQSPTRTQKAHIDQLLRQQEQAHNALAQHQEHAYQNQEEEAAIAPLPLPSKEARNALQVAQAEVTRAELVLQQLSVLPMEIKTGQRALDTALSALNFSQLSQLQHVRPMVDAQLDEALTEKNANDAQRTTFTAALADTVKALDASRQELQQLTLSGPVATRDDVMLARKHRDLGWQLIQATYVQGRTPEHADYTQGMPLPAAFDAALKRADELIDQFAADTQRAMQLQRLQREIQDLETEQATLQQALNALEQRDAQRQASWDALLASSNLPALTPAALRDWQRLLPIANQAAQALQAKQDQLEHARQIENALIDRLQETVHAIGVMAVAPTAGLQTLIAAAEQIQAQLNQHDALVLQASGRHAELQRQRQRHQHQEEQLHANLAHAKTALQPVMHSLFLPPDATPSLVRSRLQEFDELQQSQAQRVSLQEKHERARAGLELIEARAQSIQTLLGDSKPLVLRLYIDQLEQRLLQAEAKQQQKTLAQQAKAKALSDYALHTETAATHQAVLNELCAMAQVETSAQLPEAEALSQRKRKVQDDVASLGAQLAQASRRTIDELRQLLVQYDAAQMDADEHAWTQELDEIGARIDAARRHEESARRELGAIDSSDAAASARDAMERAAATVHSTMPHWIRTRLAQALLAQALKSFRERAQGPMLTSASAYFARMTGQEFTRLVNDDSDEPVLLAERHNGALLRVGALSEGTRDQLYLALRLAALDLQRRAGVDLPAVFDDILMTSDERRSKEILEALADFSSENQVILLTHHKHILDMAKQYVPSELLHTVEL